MSNIISIDVHSSQPKYRQISEAVISSIETGSLQRGEQLPSISELATSQNIAKVTVAKAYEDLRQRGVIQAQHGKGFYVATNQVRNKLNLFILFDTLNAYKETLYYALKEELPTNTQLSLFFHHYDRELFDYLIKNNLGNYNYYVIMPHFNEDVADVINLIPKDKLLIIDKDVDSLNGNYAAVFQDFARDIFEALTSGLDLLKNYTKLTLIRSTNQFQFIPAGIITGFKKFGKIHGIYCQTADKFKPGLLKKGEAYLLFTDRDMVSFIKEVNTKGLKLGSDVGLISYDDTPMKEILEGGITVISTDFEKMGRTAGQLINTRTLEQKANPARLIRRNSL